MMPTQHEIEIPLLRALASLGGSAPTSAVYPAVTKQFPELTEADKSEPLASGTGNRWTNRIQWVRQTLLTKGEVASAGFGIWAITAKGLERLKGYSEDLSAPAGSTNVDSNLSESTRRDQADRRSTNLEEVNEEYVASFKQKVLNKLLDLSPEQFEKFAETLIKGYGFQKTAVTGKVGDGGIDGHGQLKVGMAVVKAAFQCKRWQNPVGSKEVQAFRGAIQGQFEQGYFFTTSTFTKAAQQESIKGGAAPVILFEGEQIVEIMIEKGVGIKRQPIELYEDQLEQLFEG